jgi:chorismate mutase/prephenate dehydratase
MFFIDLEGHQDDEVVEAALAEVQMKAGFFKILGSYPKTV